MIVALSIAIGVAAFMIGFFCGVAACAWAKTDTKTYDIDDAEKVIEWLKARGLEPRQ